MNLKIQIICNQVYKQMSVKLIEFNSNDGNTICIILRVTNEVVSDVLRADEVARFHIYCQAVRIQAVRCDLYMGRKQRHAICQPNLVTHKTF